MIDEEHKETLPAETAGLLIFEASPFVEYGGWLVVRPFPGLLRFDPPRDFSKRTQPLIRLMVLDFPWPVGPHQPRRGHIPCLSGGSAALGFRQKPDGQDGGGDPFCP